MNLPVTNIIRKFLILLVQVLNRQRYQCTVSVCLEQNIGKLLEMGLNCLLLVFLWLTHSRVVFSQYTSFFLSSKNCKFGLHAASWESFTLNLWEQRENRVQFESLFVIICHNLLQHESWTKLQQFADWCQVFSREMWDREEHIQRFVAWGNVVFWPVQKCFKEMFITAVFFSETLKARSEAWFCREFSTHIVNTAFDLSLQKVKGKLCFEILWWQFYKMVEIVSVCTGTQVRRADGIWHILLYRAKCRIL